MSKFISNFKKKAKKYVFRVGVRRGMRSYSD